MHKKTYTYSQHQLVRTFTHFFSNKILPCLLHSNNLWTVIVLLCTHFPANIPHKNFSCPFNFLLLYSFLDFRWSCRGKKKSLFIFYSSSSTQHFMLPLHCNVFWWKQASCRLALVESTQLSKTFSWQYFLSICAPEKKTTKSVSSGKRDTHNFLVCHIIISTHRILTLS